MSKFKTILKKSGLRQKDLAELSGASEKTISRAAVLGIKTPRLAQIYAPFLGCSWIDLIETPGGLNNNKEG